MELVTDMTSIAIADDIEVLYCLTELAHLDSASESRLLARVVAADPRFVEPRYAAAGAALLTARSEALEDAGERAAFTAHAERLAAIIRSATSAGSLRFEADETTRLLFAAAGDQFALLRILEADWLAVRFLTSGAELEAFASSAPAAARRGFVAERFSGAAHDGYGWDGAGATARLAGGTWVAGDGIGTATSLVAFLEGQTP